MSFQIGSIADPVFYTRGRDDIPSFTVPFRNLREWFDIWIRTHGVQKIIEENLNLGNVEERAATKKEAKLANERDW